jgi:hypothetical protein
MTEVIESGNSVAAAGAIKRAVLAAYRREALGHELCPSMYTSREADKDTLRALARVEREISELCEQLRVTDGFRSVLGSEDAHDAVIVAIALLVAQALTGDARFGTVADLATTAGGRCATTLVDLHEAWRHGGVLRRICRVGLRGASNLGELGNPTLRESVLRQLLELDPDSEFDEIDAARELLESK